MDHDDNAPTLVTGNAQPAPAVALGEAPPLLSSPPALSTVGGESLTATAAVVEEQRARGRAIVRIGAVVGAVSAVVLQLPPDQDRTGRIIATVALMAITLSSLGIMVREKAGGAIDQRHVFWLSMVVTPSVVVVMWHVGVTSPTVMALIFGIYYFGLSDRKIEGWVCYLTSAVGFGGIATATALGWIPGDRAIFAHAAHPVSVLAITLVVELMLAGTFWLARLSRGATLDAMAKLERAHRQIRDREALLGEVAQDLDEVIGKGRRGRYTGEEIGGFVAEHVIGRGAMGEVYCGRRGELEAAIKVLHPHYVDSKMHLERFLREARVSAALTSPHIVEVHSSGITDDGAPYLAMELLVGHDLAWHLRQRRRFSIKETLKLVDQVALALNEAREAGIVHRDLKPSNVFLDERPAEHGQPPRWKVLDFGVSKILASGTLTHGDILGTPGYMAPEQARTAEIDHRADVFSLGALVYRMLTGRPAFGGDHTMQVLYRVGHTQPHRPSSIVKLPADVDLVLALALAKEPERRIRSASTFAAVLRDASRSELDARLRADATALLAAQPWGSGRE